MTKETLEELAVLLRADRIEIVKQAEREAGELPLFEWVEARLQPTELITEVFTSDEVQWLSIAWLGRFLSTVEDPQNYDIGEILQINGNLELRNDLLILPDCWDRFYTKKAFDIVLYMDMIEELPLTWARSSCIQTIKWIAGECTVPDALTGVNIVYVEHFQKFLDRDRLDSWEFDSHRPFRDVRLYWFLAEEDRYWINGEMMTSIWEFSDEKEYRNGNAGHYEVIYATGTQEVLHLSLSYITVSVMGTPCWIFPGRCDHYVNVNPTDYVQAYLRNEFTPPVSRIPEYPHRLDKLKRLIPTPDTTSSTLVYDTQAVKDSDRQEVLAKLEELEQVIQAAKQQWRQW